MTDETRAIELEIDVPGTPEEVWRAIATGPGISSWYVPHVVEERTGGTAKATFGEGPGMEIEGRVAAWEPPHRIVFDKGEGEAGLAFEWLVEARGGGICRVRLVNTGFGTGAAWDAQYDAMTEGWRLFMLNLRLHLEHFPGQTATALLPLASWEGSAADVWAALTGALGLPAAPAVGERVAVGAPDAPRLAGVVVDRAPHRLALVVDEPVPGTAFISVEARQDPARAGIAVWAYLYGAEGAAAAARDTPAWRAWLEARA